ncbi:MAG: hypothetical protein Q7S41_04410 [Candidatus Limnocylindria bacterium]|nr:hypothetical protein [Candidatus Limnocylindria bacterium]
MLRTVAAVEQRPWLLLAIVFLTTAFFGFLVQALGNVYLRWRMDPLVTEYRATLSYTSAVIGDGVLVPLVNVFMTSQLALWRRRPNIREVAGAILGGAFITVLVSIYQATQDLRNWAMTKPWEWTPIGYYHALFMWAEISFVLFFWGQLALIAKEDPRAILSYRVALMFVCGALFLRLLFADYGYIN